MCGSAGQQRARQRGLIGACVSERPRVRCATCQARWDNFSCGFDECLGCRLVDPGDGGQLRRCWPTVTEPCRVGGAGGVEGETCRPSRTSTATTTVCLADRRIARANWPRRGGALASRGTSIRLAFVAALHLDHPVRVRPDRGIGRIAPRSRGRWLTGAKRRGGAGGGRARRRRRDDRRLAIRAAERRSGQHVRAR